GVALASGKSRTESFTCRAPGAPGSGAGNIDRARKDGTFAARRGGSAGRGSGSAVEMLEGHGALAYRQRTGEAATLHGTEEDMSRHVIETDLALYAAGDLPVWRGAVVKFHVRGCAECRALVEALRLDRQELRRSADD